MFSRRLPVVRDGRRVYGVSAWMPDGVAEDPMLCIAEVSTDVGVSSPWVHQCTRPRGHGRDGLFCRQHATPRRPGDDE